MIARRLGMRQKKRSDIVRLVEYITSAQSRNHRVGEVFISNCMNDDPDMAAREMLTKQLLNARSKADKTYHLLVSFKYGEQPTEQVLRKIEAALCAKLGFAQHQRIAVVHRDTDHTHMHIAINKIHPKKLTIKTPYRDFKVLGEACSEIERNLFLQQDNHTPTGKTRGERLAGDIEAKTGNESLHTWIHREVFQNLQKADSWEALHRELAKAGLSFALRGAGLVGSSQAGHKSTGSNIDSSFSKFHLEKRLGAFQKRPAWCDDITPEKEYLRNPNAPVNPLREEYEKLRDSGDEAKDMRLAAIAMEYTRKKEAILAENVFDKAQARNTSMGRFAKRKLYDAIHKKFRGQMASLNAEAKRARQEVFTTLPSRSWAAWLQEQARAGRPEAVDALRKRAFSLARSGGAALRGDKEVESGPAPDQKIDGVTKHGAVIYDMGNDSVRDDRDSFRISAGAAPETDIMALTLAKRRFGNVIHVDGDRAFRERMVRAAVNGNVYIKFGDPEMERQRNQLYRQQYQQKKAQHRPDDGPGRDGQNTQQTSPSR